MKTLVDWLFGPRTIKLDLGDRVIAPALYLTEVLDTSKVLDTRKEHLINMKPTAYEQEVGRLYGGKVTVRVDFNEWSVGE